MTATNTAATEREPAPQQQKSSRAIALKGEADSVRTALERMRPQFQMALPRHLTPDRLLRVAMTAIQNTPKLLDCDRTSLYSAIMTCAQLGLEPDGVLGQAYLVPFGGKVQFIPGYKGLIALARNSGDVVSIQAHEVCKRDQFSYAFGLNEKLEHIPHDGDRGEITHFYAVARFKDGGHHFDVMTKAEVDVIRSRSPGRDQDPWKVHYTEMGKKTAIRRIAKYLPLNVQKAAALADSYDGGRHATLDVHGDVTIEGEAQETIGTERQIARAGSKLEKFEQEHGANGAGEKIDAATGEVTKAEAETAQGGAVAQGEASAQTQAGAEAKQADKPAEGDAGRSYKPAPEPTSPERAKKGQKAEWPTWVTWAVAEIKRMPRERIVQFMEERKAEMDFVAENRRGDWEKVELAIDARRTEG